MLHAGIIGLGKMGLSHAAIVNPHPDVELVGVCDTSSIVLEAFRKFSTIRVYDDYKKMIDTEKPDLLIVASRRSIIMKWSVMLWTEVFTLSVRNRSV